MQVYQTDADGFFVGVANAEESPLEPGQFLIPNGAVETAPPALAEDQKAQWDGNGWLTVDPPPTPVPDPPPPLTTNDVNMERQRRIQQGVTVTVTGAGDIPLQGGGDDQTALLGLVTAANMRLAIGDTTHITKFRDAVNVDHDLTPVQIVEMWSLGSAWVQSILMASWVIKAIDPIPTDYADDSYWP